MKVSLGAWRSWLALEPSPCSWVFEQSAVASWRSNAVIIVQTKDICMQRSFLGCITIIVVISAMLVGCRSEKAGEALSASPAFSTPLATDSPDIKPTVTPTVRPTIQSIIQPTPTLLVLGRLFAAGISLKAGPFEVPLEIQIPKLNVNAPMLAVGLTSGNVMDAPKGPATDPVWHTAFWYRGGGIPGDVGTATIAGHVNNPLGQPEIFAHIQDLHSGDLIIILDKYNNNTIRFIVNQVKIYSIQQSTTPAVFTQIFGAGPVTGTGPQPAPDGLSHLTLITCAGTFVDGQFDHRTVVYATRAPNSTY
jgi:hypothetical protein